MREVLRLVRSLTGISASNREAQLDETAHLSAAYERAAPIVRRRFYALAGEMSAWAAAGVEALLAGGSTPTTASAERLAETIEDGLQSLSRLLRKG